MRKLSPIEEKRLQTLTAKAVELSLLEPTSTGLKKSILDATEPVRRHLKVQRFHDYMEQSQGKANKALLSAAFLYDKGMKHTKVSLYRPETKKGDPRIWFYGLKQYAEPNDVLALIVHQQVVYVINISRIEVDTIIERSISGPVLDLLNAINNESLAVSDELIKKLKDISAMGFVPSTNEGRADTAIGRTLETLLGIKINSSKEPDYKGIELKSFRSIPRGKETRKNLFAQVPNWSISPYKSSKQILDSFGYQREDAFKLYCTVSTISVNPQGLQLEVDENKDQLLEKHIHKNLDEQVGVFAIWIMDDLRKRLSEKHNETFWIKAESKVINGKEHFHFKNVIHTRKPILTQFDVLLQQGMVTLDHLIKRSSNGRVSEKGPLFKIDTTALGLLFPPSLTYDLTSRQ